MNSPAESISQTSEPQEVVISAIDVADFNTSSIPDESMVTITVYTAKSRASTSCNKATFINAFLPDYIEKKRLGRYSLIEAALMLERYANADPISMVEKLEHSVSTKVLTVFAPGKTDKYHSERVRDFYEEVYWDDLNVWLVANESRIDWRFPNPQSVTSKLVEASARHLTPSGGDALTPIIWEICDKLSAAGQQVTARYVMSGLSNCDSQIILSKTAGGLRYETLAGDEKELTIEQLRARIKNWKKAKLEKMVS